MRVIELICCCVITFSFLPFISGTIIPAIKIHSQTVQIKYELNRDKFLYNGFINMCKNTDDSQWYFESAHWKNICTSLWEFEELTIKRNGKFFEESWKCNGKKMKALFYKNQESL